MKAISDLELGYSDAENYRRRENKEILNRVFVRNSYLDRLCDPAISFLMGEKGTGKTAYAVYLANNDYKDTLGSLKYIRETEYQKFVVLKREKSLTLSDYVSIWRVIIYLLMSQQIKNREGGLEFIRRFTRMGAIQAAIDEYYHRAFSPEIIQALQFVQESKIAAEILSKHAKIGAEDAEAITFSESRFQTNLFYIQNQFEQALSQARLKSNHILFIDGIDIRPEEIPYPEYLDCIKGLANAVWEVNNDFFPTIKGGGGRMRVVLLVRPDIFESLGLQNQNTKARDNSVFLDWRTEYANHRSSDIFRTIDHLLSSQQHEALPDGAAWDAYFPWDATNVFDEYEVPTSFIAFLRWSYYRPRDIITMLKMLQDLAAESGKGRSEFTNKEFEAPEFQRVYSDYLLGEVKDHLTFYYSKGDYERFLKFFEYLHGRNKFSWEQFVEAYEQFQRDCGSSKAEMPRFMASSGDFLQFLYDLNVLCYIERPVNDKPYVRWCFRERSYANIAPKVKQGVEYQIFYGLAKSLNVGQEFRRS
ncbi:P-loop ATPase, Sll1717 family [Chromohalobacter israelensis]|uniref:P-loop ATPase, Sll1717 family n=1 Tax=Chromohalobacter israelensis TaxID=141390 RepID=UPI00265C2B27|nr:hypothetical protein [Chromohalobacter salexigens]MDO0947435.1 hypothetical protein [Chromohalobacter salexigens]